MNTQFFTVDMFTPVQLTEEEVRASQAAPRKGVLRVFLPSFVARMAIAVAMSGTIPVGTISRTTAAAPTVQCVHAPAQPGYVIDHEIGRGIASLLQFRLQSDDPTDDDLISSHDLL